MELKIKTLTPLWTGGVETGKVDRIHETGLLGSLRWWYEAIVRGLGGKACDPSQGECRFDAEKYEQSKANDERQRLRDAGLCDVCQVFGATGRKRRFRLTIFDNNAKPDSSVSSRIKADRSYESSQKKRTPTWYFPDNENDKPRSGTLTLQIQSLDPAFPPNVIAGLIQFIADWAALGARAQMGFGVVELVDGRGDPQPLYDWLVPVAGRNSYPDLPSLRNIFLARISPMPSLRNIFLARISPKDGGQFSKQDTFNLKYDLRQLFASNDSLRHFIMGTVQKKRMAAKVKMSRPCNDGREMRVWGWIPEQADAYQGSWNRDAVVGKIHQHLNENYCLRVWREMNSTRDTVTPDNGDAKVFLQSLLGLKEEEDAA